jgi:prepilin-type processing-associated H-X9-DG protein
LKTVARRQFGSYHPGVVHFAFGDGRVQVLKNSTPGSVLALLANRADGRCLGCQTSGLELEVKPGPNEVTLTISFSLEALTGVRCDARPPESGL